jgi:sec-independent protein translocase protein TatA
LEHPVGLDNPLHIAFLLVILLLVFGAKRLPEMGRSLGHGLRGFKDAISGDAQPEHVEHLTMAEERTPEHAEAPRVSSAA